MPKESSTQRSDARANRAALLHAATVQFAEFGTEIPFEDIATAAGVGRATLYRHFASRDVLLAAILDATLDEIEAEAAQLASGPGRLRELFDLCLRLQRERLPAIDLANEALTANERKQLQLRIERLFREPLQEAMAAGLIRPGITARDVRITLVMLSALARRTVDDEDRRRARELALGALETHGVAFGDEKQDLS